MVKKSLLSLAIAASVAGLTGCQISSVERHNDNVNDTPTKAGTDGIQPSTVSALFNPARSELPTATDFLFNGSTDGTVVYPAGEQELFLADGSRNPEYNPVFNALNDLDGFSTSAPMYIPFSGALQEGEVSGNAVFLVPLDYTGGPKLGSINEALPYDLSKLAETSIQAEVISYADGDKANSVLKVSPTKPLANDTRYLVVVTNDLLDAKGNPTVMPSQYRYLIGDGDLVSDALSGARTIMKDWYLLAAGFMSNVRAADPSKVTLAYTFTTGGTTEVLNTMAAPGNANAALSNSAIPASVQYVINSAPDLSTAIATLTSAPYNMPLASAQGAAVLSNLPSPSPRVSDFSASALVNTSELVPGAESDFRTGSIELPYYLSAPLGAYAGEDKTSGYACTPASDADVECLQKQFTAANVIAEYWRADEDVIYDIQVAGGGAADDAAVLATKAPSTRVTNLFPFAKEQGKVSVPVMVVEPVDACGAKPASGWPVVIYQHGITSNRMATLPLADELAKECYATVAIDLPMHGPTPNQTFSKLVAPETTAEIPVLAAVNASANSTQSLTTFLGLPAETQALIVQGQTVAQRHFGLTVAADGVSPMPMSAENAQSGSLYIDLIRFQTSRDNNRQAVMDLLNLNATLPFMDIDNDGNAGGPDFDKDNIYFAGISLGGIIGTQFVAVNNANVVAANANGNSALNPIKAAVLGVAGGGLPKLLENSGSFGPQIVGGLTNPAGFNLTQGGANYETLLYVMQAMVDSADPINFAAQLKATQTPFTFIESIGDNVVPNSVEGAPLAGTDPLVEQLGATQVDENTDFTAEASNQVLIRLVDEYSSHGSMAAPDTDDVTPETPETFTLLADHIVSLFDNPTIPTLSDGSVEIIEPVAAE